MWITVSVLVLVVGSLCLYVARTKGNAALGEGFQEGGKLFVTVIPNILLGFIMAGMLMVLLPKDAVGRWMGAGSGFRGLAVGTLAGFLTPGGPFLQFPIVASLLKAGAGVGSVTAYVVAWGTLGLQRFLVWELPILGWKIALVRFAGSLVVPFIAGLLAQAIAALARVPTS